MLGRIANLFKAFLNLFITSVEKQNPEALLELEKENLRKQIGNFNQSLASHAGLAERLMGQVRAAHHACPARAGGVLERSFGMVALQLVQGDRAAIGIARGGEPAVGIVHGEARELCARDDLSGRSHHLLQHRCDGSRREEFPGENGELTCQRGPEPAAFVSGLIQRWPVPPMPVSGCALPQAGDEALPVDLPVRFAADEPDVLTVSSPAWGVPRRGAAQPGRIGQVGARVSPAR